MNHDTNSPLRVAIIGMGGFAGMHHEAVLELERRGVCRLICTCDPIPSAFHDKTSVWRFAERGVSVHDDYRHMLAQHSRELDVVTIPTPVPLHAEMHQIAIEHRLPVYLEKPPTLDIQELNAMLQTELRAVRDTNVGFNFIIEQPRKQIKSRLIRGEFGRLNRVGFTGSWSRSSAYYMRARWAGRLSLGDRLVLDSPMGNAMAHYVHNILYWAGTKELEQWATVDTVLAEMYRAHAIEGTDTIFLRATTPDAITLDMAFTHACDGKSHHIEWLECDRARITYTTFESAEIRWHNGSTERIPLPNTTLTDNMAHYFAFLQNAPGLARPSTRLIDCKTFVTLNDLAYLSSGAIYDIDSNHKVVRGPDHEQTVAIDDIESIMKCFVNEGKFPSDQSVPWAHSSLPMSASALARWDVLINAMVKP